MNFQLGTCPSSLHLHQFCNVVPESVWTKTTLLFLHYSKHKRHSGRSSILLISMMAAGGVYPHFSEIWTALKMASNTKIQQESQMNMSRSDQRTYTCFAVFLHSCHRTIYFVKCLQVPLPQRNHLCKQVRLRLFLHVRSFSTKRVL